MLALALLAQLAAVQPAMSDSAALLEDLKEARFRFLREWRYQVEYDQYDARTRRERTDEIRIVPGARGSGAPATGAPATGAPAPLATRPLRAPEGDCDREANVRLDIDQRSMLAHMVKKPGDAWNVVCAGLTRQAAVRAPMSMDQPLTVEARAIVRAARGKLLRRLDSAARIHPGDSWIAAQRARLYMEQDDATAALRVARECRVAGWWCRMLQGHVFDQLGDPAAASRAITAAYAEMPRSVMRRWEDIEMLLPFSAQEALVQMSPQKRDSIAAVAWWLADPLFLDETNDRHTEQLLRHFRAELHAGEVDTWTDWRPEYHGPTLSETVIRYGWPTDFQRCRASLTAVPTPWGWGDSKSIFLGCPPGRAPQSLLGTSAAMNKAITAAVAATAGFGGGRGSTGGDYSAGAGGGGGGDGGGASPTEVTYAGPLFHLIPRWSALLDPLRSTATDWDLAPPRDVGPNWDASWWATELYARRAGPVVPVFHQIGMFRRFAAPVLAAAMEWDTAGYTFRPPPRVIAGAITMTGPAARRVGIRDTMSTSALRGLLGAIPSEPTLLSLEMIPRDGSGTSGRARFGIAPPPPLSRLPRADIALSDPILVRAADNDGPPANIVEARTRMIGTTRLVDPRRIGLFWELYGGVDGDALAVSVKFTRHDDANLLARAGAAMGIGSAGSDSLIVEWTEPRRGDPGTMVDSGVTIRPRGVVLNISALRDGSYSIEVSVRRGSAVARATRAMSIVR